MNSQSHGPARPNVDDVERGTCYFSQIGNELDFAGVIRDESGEIRWRFETQPKRSPFSPVNLLNPPEFVVTNPDGEEVLRVCRKKLFSSHFEIIENAQVVGKIEGRSLLRNNYTFDLESGSAWAFHMPLFSLRFQGKSNENSHVWVMVGPSKRQWNILVEPGADSVRLLATLAFIHRQWWCFS